ncbi:Zinc finger CCCH domain-containing protein 11A [Dictyocoela muelleri]|nr:Zinc finger CCCH domain-containing protein 11A [Dictyocoela muelleri]
MSTDDCYYFLYSICAKKDCKFRHNKKAKETTIICPLYSKKLNCQNDCPFRHSTYHLKKKRTEMPCYWEENSQCKKLYCEFKHKDPEKDKWKYDKTIKTLDQIKSEEVKKNEAESFINEQLRIRELAEKERLEMIERLEKERLEMIKRTEKDKDAGYNKNDDRSSEVVNYEKMVKDQDIITINNENKNSTEFEDKNIRNSNSSEEETSNDEPKNQTIEEAEQKNQTIEEAEQKNQTIEEVVQKNQIIEEVVQKRKIAEFVTRELNKKYQKNKKDEFEDDEKGKIETNNSKKDNDIKNNYNENKPENNDEIRKNIPESINQFDKNNKNINKELEEVKQLEELLKHEGIDFEE